MILKKFFLFFLFLAFALPSPYILPIGFSLQYRELAFLILPFINLFISKKTTNLYDSGRFMKIQKAIYLFLGIVLMTELVVKKLLYDQNLGDSLKSLRIGLPLFSGLILLSQGLRVSAKSALHTLLYSILTSFSLSLVNVYIPLPFLKGLIVDDVLAFDKGRVRNLNFSFGIIGLYLLMQNENRSIFKGALASRASFAGIVSLISSFNRTYLAVLAIEFSILLFKNFAFQKALKIGFISILLFSSIFYLYNNNEILQNQLNNRFISILTDISTLEESTIENNRDYIYEAIQYRISEGYWIIGLPYRIPVFLKNFRYDNEERAMVKTDISLFNILLRYGIIPLVLLLSIFLNMIKYKSYFFNLMFGLYLLASLNIDSLLSHNSIFFLLFLFMVITHSDH